MRSGAIHPEDELPGTSTIYGRGDPRRPSLDNWTHEPGEPHLWDGASLVLGGVLGFTAASLLAGLVGAMRHIRLEWMP